MAAGIDDGERRMQKRGTATCARCSAFGPDPFGTVTKTTIARRLDEVAGLEELTGRVCARQWRRWRLDELARTTARRGEEGMELGFVHGAREGVYSRDGAL